MEYIVKDRQTLLDVAIITLGSPAGVFALAVRNGISITSRLSDGQAIRYEMDDVIAPRIRRAYQARNISPATDILHDDWQRLLIAAGRFKAVADRRPVDIEATLTRETEFEVMPDPLDLIIADIRAGKAPAKTNAPAITRYFCNEFDDTFA